MEINLSQFYYSLAVIAIIILVGFILGKMKWIDDGTNKKLVNLLLMVFMPASLYMAFPNEYPDEYNKLFIFGLIAGFIVMIAMILVAKIVFNKKLFKKTLSNEAQFAFVFNNATFLGYPIVSTVFGEEGIIAYCGFIIAFNLALFSYGVWLFKKKMSWRFIIDILKNPNIIAVVVGAILAIFKWRAFVPDMVNSSIGYLANITTPLSLICIGYMLSAARISKVIKKWRLFIVALIQLILAPLATWGILKVLQFPSEVVTICTLIQALPTATSLGLFAEKYGGNTEESSELVVISTIMSIVTLPIMAMLLF